MPNLLMIDNYDSFTYNLVRYFEELGVQVKTVLHDKISLLEVEMLKPDYIVISPGPKTPKEAGISNEIIRHFAGRIPILGVCLGHQCIGDIFGAKVVQAEPVHGKISLIYHSNTGMFTDLPSPFTATRYHSLIVKDLPDTLEMTAWTESYGQRIVMGIRHKEYPIEGVQFHPESILTEHGHQLLRNFLTGSPIKSRMT
ncbi:MAG: aminodeoxychorismate/anthranilate synthase component II [Gammaproteobacteria bacterium]|nr:aminodeoxychorismate/anthranilate synthase component II [Gammaproteobacteria bacterium]